MWQLALRTPCKERFMAPIARSILEGGLLLLLTCSVLTHRSAQAEEPVAVEKSPKAENPYIPRKGMSTEDLHAYIQRLQEAPETIRNRPGFAEGIAIAAQRILDNDPEGSLRTFAMVNLLD